ncbi:SDR family oxidoreductase [Vibrio alginolyticus]|jgi:meso-butanediol dehydrogenase/(S,S)-butanediol dehydrogenase/diacetyl reductase|uniref:NAD(P)-dependent oxidoreductase n=3 Tax=Vibrio harveyi group TaxID=717610 RepID=A0A0P7EH68_VIBAL|nr:MULTISPECIES: SDR family oxidoreductase [Vibrio]MDG2789024.1 SDR family oxidoreductase [Vibrio parahaemolyticus]MDW2257177.1 SDR family oxidoreductase [Vibrio sp. 1409]AGV19841.1 oxidoreductase, short-chain dehydrogenase/reductase family protein [Vibrio alginolyticus NBRC 15630 = ATCC 17749]AVF68693.1 NAD(P)-dependent oxidoreductase [Vibrio alginolyticus]EGQ8054864.1 SDR family oxidoreductase [Vibrio alginolyticus]
MRGLKNKVALVTGSANGIGLAIAKRLYEEGANVALADWNEEQLANAVEGFDKQRVSAHSIDVSDPEKVAALISDVVTRFGKLDILVNNAGVHVPGSVIEGSVEDWKKISGVNIDGVVYCAKFALPELLKTKGCMVNTASVSGLGGDWGAAFYCASKGAVVNLTRAMALDHGADGVRINAVCPSLVKTNMTNGWPQDIRDKFNERIALGRAAEPEEIASVVTFLASDDASFINGVNLPVDGGATASDGQPKIV